MSRRETLIAAITARLAAMIGDAAYTYGPSLKSVQRYIHSWDGERPLGNDFSQTPTIVVRTVEETTDVDTDSTWTNTITLDIWFVLRGDTANDADLNAALADMKRALFINSDPVGLFGVGGRLVTMTNQLMNLATGEPADGLHLNLTVVYDDRIGDPTTE